MDVNFKKFRLSIYRIHKVTGLPPVAELHYGHYLSGDNGGVQKNFVFKILYTTLHFKWRSKVKK